MRRIARSRRHVAILGPATIQAEQPGIGHMAMIGHVLLPGKLAAVDAAIAEARQRKLRIETLIAELRDDDGRDRYNRETPA